MTSGRIWAEALQTAEALHDQFWIERVSGELAVIAFLKGDTATAVKLNARAFQIANELKDLQGEIRQKSLESVGSLEQQRFDDCPSSVQRRLEIGKNQCRYSLSADGLYGQSADAGHFRFRTSARSEVALPEATPKWSP